MMSELSTVGMLAASETVASMTGKREEIFGATDETLSIGDSTVGQEEGGVTILTVSLTAASTGVAMDSDEDCGEVTINVSMY